METAELLFEILLWEYVEPVAEYEYQEKSEFFAYHHLAHMKYHFVNGGCGIRPFLDLYVMRKGGFYEETKLIELLDRVGLTSYCPKANIKLDFSYGIYIYHMTFVNILIQLGFVGNIWYGIVAFFATLVFAIVSTLTIGKWSSKKRKTILVN